MKHSEVLVAVVALAAAALGCSTDAECDDDQELVEGACVAKGGGGGTGGAATDGGAGGEGGSTSDGGTSVGGGGGEPGGGAGGTSGGNADGGACTEPGDPCVDDTNHSDCGCDAPYCAIQPGMSEGICTITGCADDASVCPDTWTCLDLSLFQAGLPSICTPP